MTGLDDGVHVGALEDFPRREMRIVEVEGRSIGVVNTEQGFRAVLNKCPHQGAEICRGQVTGTMVESRPQTYVYSEETLVIRCPWHRWEFDLVTGKSFGKTNQRRLMTFEVDIRGGQVYVKRRSAKSGESHPVNPVEARA